MGDTFPIFIFVVVILHFYIRISVYLDGLISIFIHTHIHTRFLMRGFVDGCMFGWVSDGLFLPVNVSVSGCYFIIILRKNLISL